jgi:hypothetical protein
MNLLTHAISYLLIFNLAMPSTNCQCASEMSGTIDHGNAHSVVHDTNSHSAVGHSAVGHSAVSHSAAGHNSTGHHPSGHGMSHVSTPEIAHNEVAITATSTHQTCLEENCTEEANLLVVSSHNELALELKQDQSSEPEYAFANSVFSLTIAARGPPQVISLQNPPKVTYESPLTRFDRQII